MATDLFEYLSKHYNIVISYLFMLLWTGVIKIYINSISVYILLITTASKNVICKLNTSERTIAINAIAYDFTYHYELINGYGCLTSNSSMRCFKVVTKNILFATALGYSERILTSLKTFKNTF